MPPNPVLQRLVTERTQANANIDAILDAANEEERDPTEAERQLISRHRDRLTELEPQIAELLDLEEQRTAARDASALVRSTPEGEQPAALTRTTPESQPDNPYSHFGQMARDEILVRFDKIAARAGQGARERASERLQRAVANTLSTDIPGIVPAQHLAQILDVISRARPVVDACRAVGLTSGVLTYPKIAQRPIVGPQAGGEKTELPSQKMQVTLETANAKVFGGAGDLSWQSVVWSNPDALNLWFELAAEAYARTTEGEACTILAAGASAGPAVGTDDLAGWMGALTAAAGSIYDATGRRADTLFCSSAVGYSLLGMVSGEAPVFLSAGPGNLAAGSGTIAGLRLVISNGFGAEHAIVGDSSAMLCAENAGAPVELRVVEPSIAGFEVGVVGAFLAEVVESGAFEALTLPAGAPLGRSSGRKASASE